MNTPPDTIDLYDIISFDGFDFSEYLKGEREILKPQLEGLGYTEIHFYMEDCDSFGPLVRGVTMIKDGERHKASYG